MGGKAMNYFSIERNGQAWSPVLLADDNGEFAFKDFLYMTYDEMKSDDQLEDFVVAAMEAANRKANSEDDDQTIVTLIGEDDIFIWSIIMGPGENDTIRYSLVDWKKDGNNYRYASEENNSSTP